MQTNPDLGKRGFLPALKYVASPQGRSEWNDRYEL